MFIVMDFHSHDMITVTEAQFLTGALFIHGLEFFFLDKEGKEGIG